MMVKRKGEHLTYDNPEQMQRFSTAALRKSASLMARVPPNSEGVVITDVPQRVISLEFGFSCTRYGYPIGYILYIS
jgi:hypothetical protein